MKKFKVGDWVICNEKPFIVFDVTNGIINNHCEIKECKLWQPREGEWCWFWNIYMQTPILLQFHEMNDEYFKTIFHYDSQIYWKYCEPFIGELPSFLKANKANNV